MSTRSTKHSRATSRKTQERQEIAALLRRRAKKSPPGTDAITTTAERVASRDSSWASSPAGKRAARHAPAPTSL